MFASAQPDATVRSTFWQAIAIGAELFDFSESFKFNASELGKGKHKIGVEAFVSWQTHDFVEKGDCKSQANEIEISIN